MRVRLDSLHGRIDIPGEGVGADLVEEENRAQLAQLPPHGQLRHRAKTFTSFRDRNRLGRRGMVGRKMLDMLGKKVRPLPVPSTSPERRERRAALVL
eukprot:379429-Hanusia_phi.AAC.2